MNILKRDKGSHKDHGYWLSTEINDYVCQIDYTDPLKQYDAIFSQDTAINKQLITPEKKRPCHRHRKPIKMSFVFLSNITKLPLSLLVRISSFLHIKDIVNLTMTCKDLDTPFGNEELWKDLCRRDYKTIKIHDRRLPFVECTKQFYKYLVYNNKPGIMHNTGLFWKEGTPQASELAQSVVDFIAPKNLAIKDIMRILMLRNDSTIGNILKLSWIQDKNEVQLWFSGQAVITMKGAGNISEKHEKLTAHVLRVYRGFDSEVIQNAFFLEDRYVVIEIATYLEKDADEEDEKDKTVQKSSSTLIVYDLEKEFKCLMTGEEFDIPFRWCFEDKGETRLEDHNQEQGQIIGMNKDNIKLKLLNEEEVLYYTTNKICPWIKILNLKTKDESICTKLELDSPIEDVILMKYQPLSKRNSFYVIDKALNLYFFTWNDNYLTRVRKITLENKETPIEDSPSQFQNVKGFPGICRYYQGLYQKLDKDKQNISVEYLVNNKESVFYFIELDTLDIHRYTANNSFNNWTVNENRLFLITGYQIRIYQLSFREFEITGLMKTRTGYINTIGIISQVILVNSCYTVHIICRRDTNKPDYFEVYIGSTQYMISAAHVNGWYEQYETFNITGLLGKGHQTIIPLLEDGQFEIRFDKVGLFLKSQRRTILFELENFWRTESFRQANKWENGYRKLDFSEINCKPEEKKEDKEKREAPVVIRYQEIPVNKNNQGKKEKQNKWSNKEKKGNKEENHEKQIIKHKGTKYRKNVQQNQRSEKHG